MCDICGRTLLRGERADTYLAGGSRRSVCELCKPRALHEGWVREGSEPAFGAGAGAPQRRRSLLSRLRGRRAPALEEASEPGSRMPAPGSGRGIVLTPARNGANGGAPTPVAAPGPARRRAAEPAGGEHGREPRHVRAVPTSAEQRAAAAVELFNGSEHCRTVAGVARSLGRPLVHVSPSGAHPGLVSIIVAWELCWYRYEVDLSEPEPVVRVAAQGYELHELADSERVANALADEHGSLSIAGLQ